MTYLELIEANREALENLAKVKDSLEQLLQCQKDYSKMINCSVSEEDLISKMYPFAEKNGISIEQVIVDVTMLRKEVAA